MAKPLYAVFAGVRFTRRPTTCAAMAKLLYAVFAGLQFTRRPATRAAMAKALYAVFAGMQFARWPAIAPQWLNRLFMFASVHFLQAQHCDRH